MVGWFSVLLVLVSSEPPCSFLQKIARQSTRRNIYNRYWKGEEKASNLRYIAGKTRKKGSIEVGAKIWDGLVSLPSGGGLSSSLSRCLWERLGSTWPFEAVMVVCHQALCNQVGCPQVPFGHPNLLFMMAPTGPPFDLRRTLEQLRPNRAFLGSSTSPASFPHTDFAPSTPHLHPHPHLHPASAIRLSLAP